METGNSFQYNVGIEKYLLDSVKKAYDQPRTVRASLCDNQMQLFSVNLSMIC